MKTYPTLLVPAALLALTLTLSGCGIPGGIAYAIKEGVKASDQADQDEQSAPAEPESTAPAEIDPPPAPAANPRDSIRVEQLR